MNFIVVAPPKNEKSAGSMVLYELADELMAVGFNARRVLLTQDKSGKFYISLDGQSYFPLFIDTFEKHFDPEHTIIIHGENLHHKFFDNFNVARYYLNKIGALRNIGVPRKGEFKISWEPCYVEAPDFLLRKNVIKKPINEQFRLDQPRSIDLTYVGKRHIDTPGLGRLPHTLELTRTWPEKTDEYIYLLSKTRFVFTFDVLSSVIEDAIIYGAAPVILDCKPFKDYHSWGETALKSVFDCCCDISEFEKISDNNLDEYFKNFFDARLRLVNGLDKIEKEYQTNLKRLVKEMRDYFDLNHSPTSIEQKSTQTGISKNPNYDKTNNMNSGVINT